VRQRREEKKRKKYDYYGMRGIESGRNPERNKDSVGKRRGEGKGEGDFDRERRRRTGESRREEARGAGKD